MGWLENRFQPISRGSTVGVEVRAGITTFLTMSYIIFVNPGILAAAGMPGSGVLTATVLVAAISSILMGLFTNLPYALAPGMGLNAFFAFTLVKHQGVPWETALGATFISGLVFLVLTAMNVRRLIVQAIPLNLRFALSTGIGVFIAFIGLKNAGVIVGHPATLVTAAPISTESAIFFAGLAFTAFGVMKKWRGALLMGIVFTFLLAVFSGLSTLPEKIVTTPDFSSVFFKLDLAGALKWSMIGSIFTMVMTDMFDSISSFLAIAHAAALVDENGEPLKIQQALTVDALATAMAGLFGSSAGTVYIESAAGVQSGGRTGLTAVVCGLMFLPFLFLGPLAVAIPGFATAPALVMVGVFMIHSVQRIDFSQVDEALPAFLAILLIPLTYSITEGIVWAFISYTVLKVMGGRRREIHPMMYVMALLSLVIVWNH